MVEKTLIWNWVKDWLRYVEWYCLITVRPEASLEEFFNAPVVETSYKVRNRSEELVRFGLMWKCFDIVALKGVWWVPPCLTTKLKGSLPSYLLGGYSGCDFLVRREVACKVVRSSNIFRCSPFPMDMGSRKRYWESHPRIAERGAY